MERDLNILVVEDAAPIANQYRYFLKYLKGNICMAATGAEAVSWVESHKPDLVLLDLKLPDIDGQEVLGQIKQHHEDAVVIITTGHGSVDVAVDMMRMGADDFLEKPVSADRLRTTVNNHLDRASLKTQLNTLKASCNRDQFHGFIGKSMVMQTVYRIIDCAAASQASIFITGESGTGKEVCAEAIHSQSQRRDSPFIAINCAAIPKDLMESEIFGHIKGAFTGASSERKGAAQLADGGTLFLDEVCEMDTELQKKLLRFLQTGRFHRVGSSQEQQVDVRILCATNREPLTEVQQGRFREDLYYRLHVVPVHLPPLRERGSDIVTIARELLVKYAHEDGKTFQQFSEEVESIFRRYPWPGNVRELQNVIRNIVVLNNGDTVLPEHLPAPLNGSVDLPAHRCADITPIQTINPTQSMDAPIIRPLAEVEKNVIEQAIAHCEGNIQKAANLLEVSPSTIYRKKQSWDEAAG